MSSAARNTQPTAEQAAARVARLRTSLRLAWLGPAIGILCMVGLFIFGISQGHRALLMISSSLAGLLVVMAVTIRAQLKQQLDDAIAQTSAHLG